ncbi:hypothetical protein D3C72_1822740 [compost metagenome]
MVSSGFTPLAWIRTSTWPASGCGRGNQVGVSAPWGDASTSACMVGMGEVDMAFTFFAMNSATSV